MLGVLWPRAVDKRRRPGRPSCQETREDRLYRAIHHGTVPEDMNDFTCHAKLVATFFATQCVRSCCTEDRWQTRRCCSARTRKGGAERVTVKTRQVAPVHIAYAFRSALPEQIHLASSILASTSVAQPADSGATEANVVRNTTQIANSVSSRSSPVPSLSLCVGSNDQCGGKQCCPGSEGSLHGPFSCPNEDDNFDGCEANFKHDLHNASLLDFSNFVEMTSSH